jgi:hypothetical protein
MGRDHEYEANNVGYDEQYPEPEGGIKCKNYELCGTVLPKWWYDCKGTYICTDCDIDEFGVLEFLDDQKCPICMDRARSIKYPKCGHTACVSCFRRCFHGPKVGNHEPFFPYPKLEDAYFEDPNNEKWEREFPLIRDYNIAYNLYHDYRDARYETEAYLRKCFVCRS